MNDKKRYYVKVFDLRKITNYKDLSCKDKKLLSKVLVFTSNSYIKRGLLLPENQLPVQDFLGRIFWLMFSCRHELIGLTGLSYVKDKDLNRLPMIKTFDNSIRKYILNELIEQDDLKQKNLVFSEIGKLAIDDEIDIKLKIQLLNQGVKCVGMHIYRFLLKNRHTKFYLFANTLAISKFFIVNNSLLIKPVDKSINFLQRISSVVTTHLSKLKYITETSQAYLGIVLSKEKFHWGMLNEEFKLTYKIGSVDKFPLLVSDPTSNYARGCIFDWESLMKKANAKLLKKYVGEKIPVITFHKHSFEIVS